MNRDLIISKARVRDSNFEVLRLLSMGLVITSHYNLWSYPFDSLATDFSVNILMKLIFTAGCVANIVFILLTGYFLIKTRPKLHKAICLILEMYFYSIAFLIIETILSGKNISFDHLRSGLLPFPFGNWFCVMYIAMLAISPFINKLLLSLERQEYKKLLLVLLVFFSIIPVAFNWLPYSNFAVFLTVYSIGAYIRLYPNNEEKKLGKLLVLISSLIILASIVSIYLYSVVTNNQSIINKATYLLTLNNSPFVIACSIGIFYMFKNIRIKNSTIINYLAGSVLGVYLIHENAFVREVIWKHFFLIDINTTPIEFVCLSFVKIITIFTACLMIDLIRRKLFEKIEEKVAVHIYEKMSHWVKRLLCRQPKLTKQQ